MVQPPEPWYKPHQSFDLIGGDFGAGRGVTTSSDHPPRVLLGGKRRQSIRLGRA
jgi:hypothetical protein